MRQLNSCAGDKQQDVRKRSGPGTISDNDQLARGSSGSQLGQEVDKQFHAWSKTRFDHELTVGMVMIARGAEAVDHGQACTGQRVGVGHALTKLLGERLVKRLANGRYRGKQVRIVAASHHWPLVGHAQLTAGAGRPACRTDILNGCLQPAPRFFLVVTGIDERCGLLRHCVHGDATFNTADIDDAAGPGVVECFQFQDLVAQLSHGAWFAAAGKGGVPGPATDLEMKAALAPAPGDQLQIVQH